MKKLDFDFLYAKFGLLWNKNANFSLFFWRLFITFVPSNKKDYGFVTCYCCCGIGDYRCVYLCKQEEWVKTKGCITPLESLLSDSNQRPRDYKSRALAN